MNLKSAWSVLVLWAIAVLATAFMTRGSGAIEFGSVFFICMLGSVIAIRKAATYRVEPVMLILWMIALAAVMATTEGEAANVLAPLFFICMLGSFIAARQAYSLPE